MNRHREHQDPVGAMEFRKRRTETVELADLLRRSHAIFWRPWWLSADMLEVLRSSDARESKMSTAQESRRCSQVNQSDNG